MEVSLRVGVRKAWRKSCCEADVSVSTTHVKEFCISYFWELFQQLKQERQLKGEPHSV